MRKYIPENAKLIPAEAECKFRGELFDVYQWPQEMFDGSTNCLSNAAASRLVL